MNKEQKHLPVIGIGPLLCAPMVIISAIAILLSIKGSIPFMIENKTMIYIFVGIGILLILEGIICFFGADFDVVTTINTVYFWSDTIKGLAEIYRVLKPGKSFYNVLFTKEYLDTIKYTQIGYKKFEPEELIVAGKQVGFHTVSIREISKGKSFIVIYTK